MVVFRNPTKDFAMQLYKRLFFIVENETIESESDSEDFEILSHSESLEEKLNLTLKSIQDLSNKCKRVNLNNLKDDFEYLEKFNKRTEKLNML